MSAARAFVNLRVGRYRLRAGGWPTLAAALLLPVLVGLGQWQLHRAEFKRHLQAEYDRYQTAPAHRLGPALEAVKDLRFRRLTARGYYDGAHQILLDNRVHQGQAGYHVITPLQIQGGATRVLVNRGWVTTGPDRQRLPAVAPPAGLVEVTGVATVPVRGFQLGATRAADACWQCVWPYLEVAEYAQVAPFPVQPVMVLLDPDGPGDGLVRQWQRLDAGIKTHQGYALTWFSLAAALAAIYVLVNIHKEPDVDRTPEQR